jgi:hypothetical protein
MSENATPVTTPCPTICEPDCELGAAGCHERHLTPRSRAHDPEECERQRGGSDERTLRGLAILGVNSPCGCCGKVSFMCPCCQKVSHHPMDTEQGYCSQCSWWTGDPVLGLPHLEQPCRFRETPAVRGLPHAALPLRYSESGLPSKERRGGNK